MHALYTFNHIFTMRGEIWHMKPVVALNLCYETRLNYKYIFLSPIELHRYLKPTCLCGRQRSINPAYSLHFADKLVTQAMVLTAAMALTLLFQRLLRR